MSDKKIITNDDCIKQLSACSEKEILVIIALKLVELGKEIHSLRKDKERLVKFAHKLGKDD